MLKKSTLIKKLTIYLLYINRLDDDVVKKYRRTAIYTKCKRNI